MPPGPGTMRSVPAPCGPTMVSRHGQSGSMNAAENSPMLSVDRAAALSGLAATLFPLRDKIASYPVDYPKRAGQLIAHGAHSLHQSLTQQRKRKSGNSPN